MIQLYKYWQFYLEKLRFIFKKRPVNRDFLSRPQVIGAGVRQSLTNRYSECSVCRNCELSCPVQAIRIEARNFPEKAQAPVSSNGYKFQADLLAFELDYSKCIQCGDCVSVCPTESLQFVAKPLPRSKDLESLKVDLIHLARKNRILGGQIADKFE